MRRHLLIGAALLALLSPAKAADSSVPAMTASGAIVGTQLTYCPTAIADFKCTFTQVATFMYGLVSGDATATGGGALTVTKTNGTAFGALATVTPGTGVATWTTTPSSANLAAALTDETGTGAAVFANSPTLVTPALGTPASGVATNLTGTAAGLTAGTASAVAIGGVTGLGTGVATAAAANLSAAGGITSTIASGTSAMGTSAIGSAACATVVTTAATNTATTDVVTASFNGDPTAVTGYVPATAGMLTIISYPTSGNVNFKVCNNTSASITPGAITLNWRVVR